MHRQYPRDYQHIDDITDMPLPDLTFWKSMLIIYTYLKKFHMLQENFLRPALTCYNLFRELGTFFFIHIENLASDSHNVQLTKECLKKLISR